MTTKVWVTGARGFIGQHLCRLLADQGREVHGLGHGAWTEGERSTVGVNTWLNGDICQSNLDVLAAAAGRPEVIVHLAGGSAVGPSLLAPAEDFRRTVVATSELLEWIRLRAPQTRVVLASSAAVYGGGHPGPIAVGSACEPYSPYGTHKLMAEMLLHSSAKDFGVAGAVVRLFSVYGNGLRKQLLWDLCGKLAIGRGPVVLGGSGAELRDWLHVDDAVRLLAGAAEVAGPNCPVFNGGTGAGVSVAEVAGWMCAHWDAERAPVFSGVRRAGDPDALVADLSATSARLDWQPQVSWQVGVSSYVDWYRSVQPLGWR